MEHRKNGLNFFTLVRAVLLSLGIPAFTAFSSAVSVFVVAPFMSRKNADGWIRFWARGVLKISGVEVNVRGLEHLKKAATGAIFISNHLSHFDIPVLYAALPVSFRMMAKVELFRIPLFGQALKAMGFIPVVRQTREGAMKAIQEVLARFDRGENVWIAPEGTRFQGLGIGEFKPGAFHLALKTRHPIVPICIYGTQDVLPKGSLLVNKSRWKKEIQISVLAPILSTQQPDEKQGREILKTLSREALLSEFSRLHKTSEGLSPLKKAETSDLPLGRN